MSKELPFFYHPQFDLDADECALEEATSKHCVQVLRMEEGEQLYLTDGQGRRMRATIVRADRKRTIVRQVEMHATAPRPYRLSIAFAFTKHRQRNEVFLEKSTELGIEEIYPIITEHSEKHTFNFERHRQILISASLQSQQLFLPRLHKPQKLDAFLAASISADQRLVAHCVQEEEKRGLLSVLRHHASALLLIGPEGDFSDSEIQLCKRYAFQSVSLGPNRLRSETAGLYAAAVFNAFHYG